MLAQANPKFQIWSRELRRQLKTGSGDSLPLTGLGESAEDAGFQAVDRKRAETEKKPIYQ